MNPHFPFFYFFQMKGVTGGLERQHHDNSQKTRVLQMVTTDHWFLLMPPDGSSSSFVFACILVTSIGPVYSDPDLLYWDPCSQPSIMQLEWHVPKNTRTGRSTTRTLFSSQLKAGSHRAHMTDVKESGDTVPNVMLFASTSNMTGLAMSQ